MATLKLNKSLAERAAAAAPRAPVRGSGGKSRPTLSQAQAYRAERDAKRREDQEAPARPERSTAARTDRPRSAPPDRSRSAPGDRPRHSPPDRSGAAPSERARTNAADRPPRASPADRSRPPAVNRSGAAAPDRQRANPGSDRSPGGEGDRPRAAVARRSDPKPGGPRPARADSEQATQSARATVRREPLAPPPQDGDGSLRLSKRMSQLGLASRREADEWIARGWVRVDGRIVSELGSRVLPAQHITVDAKARNQQALRVTVLVNKPVGYVSGQAEDGYEPASVLVTPQNQWREDSSGIQFVREHMRGLAPAGRLDIDSVGLLVLTQDGRVARQLIGEDSEVEKEYLVRVAMAEGATLGDDALALLGHGLELDGEALRPARVEWVNSDQLRFVLRQGKKRQIRRMCEAVGLQVLGLKRVRIGAVMLGDLPPGQWRYLRADEAFAQA